MARLVVVTLLLMAGAFMVASAARDSKFYDILGA